MRRRFGQCNYEAETLPRRSSGAVAPPSRSAGVNHRVSRLKVHLIFGFPRSGTTWLGNLFNLHPDVINRHEMLGRSSDKLDDETFVALRDGGELNAQARGALPDVIIEADPDTARHSLRMSSTSISPRAKRLRRLSTKSLSSRRPVYAHVCRPPVSERRVLIVKETARTYQKE